MMATMIPAPDALHVDAADAAEDAVDAVGGAIEDVGDEISFWD